MHYFQLGHSVVEKIMLNEMPKEKKRRQRSMAIVSCCWFDLCGNIKTKEKELSFAVGGTENDFSSYMEIIILIIIIIRMIKTMISRWLSLPIHAPRCFDS